MDGCLFIHFKKQNSQLPMRQAEQGHDTMNTFSLSSVSYSLRQETHLCSCMPTSKGRIYAWGMSVSYSPSEKDMKKHTHTHTWDLKNRRL